MDEYEEAAESLMEAARALRQARLHATKASNTLDRLARNGRPIDGFNDGRAYQLREEIDALRSRTMRLRKELRNHAAYLRRKQQQQQAQA